MSSESHFFRQEADPSPRSGPCSHAPASAGPVVPVFIDWVERSGGASLEMPAECEALAGSQRDIPQSTAELLRLGPGPHTVGQAVERVQGLRVLTGEIDAWSQLPAETRGNLADFLHQCRGRLPVSLEAARDWLALCHAPIPVETADRLGLAPGTTWAAATAMIV